MAKKSKVRVGIGTPRVLRRVLADAVDDSADQGDAPDVDVSVGPVRELSRKPKKLDVQLGTPVIAPEPEHVPTPDEEIELDQQNLQSARPGGVRGMVANALLGASGGFDWAHAAEPPAQQTAAPAEGPDGGVAEPSFDWAHAAEPPPGPPTQAATTAAPEPAHESPGFGSTAALNLGNALSLVGLPNVLAAQDAIRHAPRKSALGIARDVAPAVIPGFGLLSATGANPIEARSPEVPPGEGFQEARAAYKKPFEAMNAEHPKAALAGNLGTLLVGGNPSGIGQLAVTGAAQGGLQSDELARGDIPGALKEAGKGGLLTAGTAAALEGAGNVAGRVASPLTRKLGQALENRGAANYVRALGAKRMAPALVQKLGRMLGRNDVVPFAASRGSDAVLQRAEEILGDQGPEIGRLLEQADADAAKSGKKFEYGPVLQRINQLRDSLSTTERRIGAPLIGSKTGGYANSVFDDLAQDAAAGGGFKEANRAKRAAQSLVNYSAGDHETNIKNEIAQRVAGALNDEIESQLGQHSGPEAAEMFKTSKDLFGGAKEAAKIAGKHQASKIGAPLAAYGIPAMIAGTAAATTGHGGVESALQGLGAAAAMKALKVARDRAPAALAPIEMSAGSALKRAAISPSMRPSALMPLFGSIGRSSARALEPDLMELGDGEPTEEQKRAALLKALGAP